jgi:flagellar hook-associated protein 1
MSLISTLNTSRSGLAANQKWSEQTARNIANTNTEGYVRKEVQFSTRAGGGGGVYTSRISREVDASLDRMHRWESSKAEKARTIYEGIEEYTAFIGQPNDEQSAATKLGKFEESLITLSNNPGDAAIQRTVVDAAGDFAYSVREASATLAQLRGEVITEIRYEVSELNERFYKVAEINEKLLRVADPLHRAELQDEIGRQVDEISKVMDVRTQALSEDRVSIFSANGTPFVEADHVSDISYNAGTGQLMSGNQDISPSNPASRSFQYGSLGGLMELKDEIMPRFQLQLDELARSAIESFQAADSSLAAGQPGLFTDAQGAYNPATLTGLAGRLEVNDAVLPEEGGQLYRIRDGVGATSPGPSGDASQLRAFIDVFSQTQTYDPNTRLPADLDIRGYANNMIASQQTQRADADEAHSIATTAAETIEASRLSVQGVNLDDELQKLIIIEQSYAANSKTMNTVTKMMDTLLSIA